MKWLHHVQGIVQNSVCVLHWNEIQAKQICIYLQTEEIINFGKFLQCKVVQSLLDIPIMRLVKWIHYKIRLYKDNMRLARISLLVCLK